MISASIEDQHDEVTSSEPRPFSHDSHFSVSPHSAQSYRLQMIDEIIVIGGNGQIVAVEHPVGQRRRKDAIPVPVAPMPKRHDSLRFLWGSGHSVLGLSGARPGTFDDVRAAEDHRKFKALHHRALEGVGDIALQAFLRFLERKTASAVSEFPMIAERPRCKLAFRFQYDEHYLHERHAAQLAWKRLLTGQPPGADQTALLAADRD
jgi:CRISPR-associated protein (Cas_Csd1)